MKRMTDPTEEEEEESERKNLAEKSEEEEEEEDQKEKRREGRKGPEVLNPAEIRTAAAPCPRGAMRFHFASRFLVSPTPRFRLRV